MQKYQGVKKFHMLSPVGCCCKMMVFSPFKLEILYYFPLRITIANQGQPNDTLLTLETPEMPRKTQMVYYYQPKG